MVVLMGFQELLPIFSVQQVIHQLQFWTFLKMLW